MTNVDTIRTILTEVDFILRQRLAAVGLEVAHVMLAVEPGGLAIVRSNTGPAELGEMSHMLAQIADRAAKQAPVTDPLS